MSISYTIITDDGQRTGTPLSVVLNYNDFVQLVDKAGSGQAIPSEVYSSVKQGGLSHVKAWRRHKSLTQRQLSHRMGISCAAISAFEKVGANLMPQTKQKIADALRIDVELLFFSLGAAGLR